jgi:4,5-dihydroxyphthalate decarboxylase
MAATDGILVRGNDYEFTLEMAGTYAGTDIRYEPGILEEIYAKVLNNQPFQACEFSLSNYTMMRDRGAGEWLTAIPVFANRDFRHSIIWVRKNSPLESAEELKGKRVGVRDYTMTAAVWLRGTLLDEYGTDWRDINWVANAEQRFPTLGGVPLELVDGDPESMLLAGDLDAFISPRPRDLMQKPPEERELRPIFRDVQAVEREYFQRTGIYPINHTVVLRRELLEEYPDAARAIFEAYCAGKKRALARRMGTTFVPWGKEYWTETMGLFGGDPFPMGLTEANRKNVGTLVRYLHEQTLISELPDIDDLFLDGTQEFTEE